MADTTPAEETPAEPRFREVLLAELAQLNLTRSPGLEAESFEAGARVALQLFAESLDRAAQRFRTDGRPHATMEGLAAMLHRHADQLDNQAATAAVLRILREGPGG